jgi:hypothetical protein
VRKEAKVLLGKAVDSLVLSIDHFNSAWDRGREEAVLVLLDRAFELLLKAIIAHKGGKIREPRAKETIGFDKCVRKCLSEEPVRCLTEDQAITIQIINSLRDAAQHYILDISEQQLYLCAQSGLTLFCGLARHAFGKEIADFFPPRVLPASTSPPQSLEALIETEFTEVKRLVRPGSRKRLQARAKLRSLAIIESSLGGVRSQPSEGELSKVLTQVASGARWQDLFPGIARLRLDTDEQGLSITLRLSRTEGEPVQLVPEGTPGATIVAVRRIESLSYYSLGLYDLAKKVGLTAPRALALVRHLQLQESEDCYKEFKIGKSEFKRYSPKAADAMKAALPSADMAGIWRDHRPGRIRHA